MGDKSPVSREETGDGGVRRHYRGRRAGRIVQARRQRAINADRQRWPDSDRARISLSGPELAPGRGAGPVAQARDRPGPAVDGCRKGSGRGDSRRVESHLPHRLPPNETRVLIYPNRLSQLQTKKACQMIKHSIRDSRSGAAASVSLTVGLLNVQSLKPKLLDLTYELQHGGYDLMALNETWLRSSTPTHLLTLPGYRLLRADRPDGRGYGGVALAARDSISTSPLKVSVEPNPNSRLEALWVLVKPDKRRKFILGVVYRPPRHKVADLEADFSDLEAQYQRVSIDYPLLKILICGDLNCDLLKPSEEPAKRALCGFLSDYSLTQHVKSQTFITGSLLDVIISNCRDLVQSCSAIFCHFSPHRFIRVSLNVARHRQPRRTVTTRCLSRVPISALHNDLLRADWRPVYDSPTVTLKWNNFMDAFLPIVDLHAPLRTIRIRNARAPLLTDASRCLLSRRRAVLASHGHGSTEYKQLNRAARSAIRRDNCQEVQRRIREEGHSAMWRVIRPAVESGKAGRTLPDAAPDQLNRFFVSVGPRVAGEVRNLGEIPDLPCRLPRVGACALTLSPLSLSGLRAIVFGMSGSAARGEDGVCIRMIRMSFDAIGGVLLHLVNSSISLSDVPQSWKHSIVHPIHKNGDPSNPSNFRPISIVPVISKIVERAVHQQLYNYLAKNHLLSSTQHGFRPRHSTETALISISDHILSANDRGELSLLCLLDLSKCFDVIDHDKLLTKLQLYGIDITWFSAYLRNHTQSVSFTDTLGNSKKSTPLPNNIGIFQGSALGPLLYSVFANDLSLFAEDAIVVQYADDTQILVSGKKSAFDNLVGRMERTLSSLDIWFRANGLKVNAEKTQLMLLGSAQNLRNAPNFTVKFRDHILSPIPEAKNLGLTFDRTLNWDAHVTSLTRRCFGTLSVLSHLRGRLPSSVISVLVNALVLSQVRYCITIYGNGSKKNVSRIQKIINYGAKMIFGRKKYDHVSDLLEKLHWLNAENLIHYHTLCTAHKVLRLGEPVDLAAGFATVAEMREVQGVTGRATRQDSDLHVPRSHTEMGKRRFRCRSPRLYNDLPPDLSGLPVPLFPRRLRRYLSAQSSAPD